MTKETLVMQLMIHRMKFMWEPRWVRSIWMYNQFTFSYAFERSILITTHFLFSTFKLWSSSWATPIASWIFHTSRKPFFSLDIFLESTSLILLAITFKIILYRQLHREMGLKSLKDRGLYALGIRVMEVVFEGACICPTILNSSTTFRRSFPKSSYKPR